jgi:DNA polymerase III subunit epsilon
MKEREGTIPDIFVFVDVETTGSRAFVDRVIDIAIIRVEQGVITKRFESLVNPHILIPTYATEISGITNEDVATAPDFSEIALEIEALFKDAVFVAHNAHFDYGFLKNEFRRIGMKFSMPRLCTVKLSRSLFPKERSHDLDALMERHGIQCDRRHRAMPDALVIQKWFELMSGEMRDVCILQQLFADTLPPLLHRDVLKQLPDTPGIYFFYGTEHELLYVGKSKNIRTRVRSHFSGATTRQEEKLCAQTARVECIETPGELSALLLESQTIKTHSPLYNRALRRARTLIYAIRSYTDGYAVLELTPSESVTPTSDIVSVFRSMTQARAKLRELATIHKLCNKLLGSESGIGACFGSQLGTCNGACMQKENVLEYNKRFHSAFDERAIKSWPYIGPVIIEEKKDEHTGTAFIVDQWRLIKGVRYDHGASETFLSESKFDYDTYKILARYILDAKNRRSIKLISSSELSSILHTDHEEVSIEYV